MSKSNHKTDIKKPMICSVCGKETNITYVFDICPECWQKGDKRQC